MKLLIVVKSIDGGTGTFFLSLLKLNKLLNKKVEIKSCILETPTYRKINIKAHYCHTTYKYPEKYNFSVQNIARSLREIIWLRERITSFRPSIVLSIDIHCILITEICKLLFFLRVKTIATIHNNLLETLKNKSSLLLFYFLRIIIVLPLSRVSKLICTSILLSKDIKMQFNLDKPVETIYNGIPLARQYKKTNKKRNISKIIISVGRFTEQKDYFTLLYAFFIITKKINNCKLWLVGDGPLKKQLTKYVADKGLHDSVTFFGWRQNPASLMRKADIFVLSSQREGFSYVLLEAMSNKLPVISTDCNYGPSEILEKGKSGILVPVGNKKKLSDAMLQILSDDNMYNQYAKKSYMRSKEFTETRMLKQYSNLIEKLIN